MDLISSLKFAVHGSMSEFTLDNIRWFSPYADDKLHRFPPSADDPNPEHTKSEYCSSADFENGGRQLQAVKFDLIRHPIIRQKENQTISLKIRHTRAFC